MVVSEISSETMIAVDRVMANSRNSRPTMPPIIRIGMNTAISEMLIDITVKPTSLAPSSAAWSRVLPASRWRVMFSSTTMASSTTKPVATVRAIRDRLSRLKPRRYITPSAPSSETVTATAGARAARPLFRKKATTITTRMTANSRVRSTSCSEARMVTVRSMATDMSRSWGSDALSVGRAFLIRSTVEMMLAPGWRLITTTIAGLAMRDSALLNRPRLWTSSTPSWTSATS